MQLISRPLSTSLPYVLFSFFFGSFFFIFAAAVRVGPGWNVQPQFAQDRHVIFKLRNFMLRSECDILSLWVEKLTFWKEHGSPKLGGFKRRHLLVAIHHDGNLWLDNQTRLRCFTSGRDDAQIWRVFASIRSEYLCFGVISYDDYARISKRALRSERMLKCLSSHHNENTLCFNTEKMRYRDVQITYVPIPRRSWNVFIAHIIRMKIILVCKLINNIDVTLRRELHAIRCLLLYGFLRAASYVYTNGQIASRNYFIVDSIFNDEQIFHIISII